MLIQLFNLITIYLVTFTKALVSMLIIITYYHWYSN